MSDEEKNGQNPEQSGGPQGGQVNVGGGFASFDQGGQTVGSQVNVGGDITGDVVRGDIIHGDKFGGDKVEGDKVIIQRIEPTDARNQRNHAALRHMVRSFWIDGVLKSSLYNEMLINLGLESNPNAVDNQPWDLILQQPDQKDLVIPTDKEVIDIFDEMGQRMLILGEPGSGKTTLLLQLADALLERAARELTYPTPVVFNLSSWRDTYTTLDEWLVGELHKKYNVPRLIATKWVAQDEIVPLLDGLDEVIDEYRSKCAMAVNHFRQHHMSPLILCCRTTEYEELSIPLKLTGAVKLQPLTEESINGFIKKTGADLAELTELLQSDPEIQNLASTPLMLNVMMMASGNLSGLADEGTNSSGTLHQRILNTFVQRLFLHRGPSVHYTEKQAVRVLQWLAQFTAQQQQSGFRLEQLQPTLLTSQYQRLLYHASIRIFGLLLILFVSAATGILAGFVSPISTIATGLSIGVLIGTLIGFSFIIASSFAIWLPDLVAFCLGLIGIVAFVRTPFIFDPPYPIFDGIIFSLPGAIAGLTLSAKRPIRPLDPFAWPKIRSRLGLAWLGVLGFGLLIAHLSFWGPALTYGLIIGVSILVPFFLFRENNHTRVSYKISQNQGIYNSLYMSAKIFIIVVFFGVFVGVLWGILDPEANLRVGFTFGLILSIPIGLIASFASGGAVGIQHYLLRLTLAITDNAPWRFKHFLDYATERLFLRRVGSEYFFYHQTLHQYFLTCTGEKEWL